MNKENLAKYMGQQFIVGFTEKSVTPEVRELIHTYHVSGIILFNRNMGTPAEVLKLTTELQREAKKAGYDYPLLICADQENGIVRRLGEGTTIFPGAMALGATDHARYAYDIGYATGKELLGLGINWNLAPVLDVNNNADNPVIGVRSFGESPEKVAEFGRESMTGMQDAGVITALKHFPGHGDTSVDTHINTPVIKHDITRLEEVELWPFKECIKIGADTVLTAHISFTSLEPKAGIPATLSKNVMTYLLREKLNYTGVVTTDCMEMDAISKTIGTEKGAVAAVKAGADFVMISHTYERQKGAIKELVNAVNSGEIEMEAIERANERIYNLKKKYLNWDNLSLDNAEVPEEVGSQEHQDLATEVYRHSTTIVKNNNILPLVQESQVLVLYPENNLAVRVEDQDTTFHLGEAVQNTHPMTTTEKMTQSMTMDDINDIVQKAKQYDAVIVGTLRMSAESGARVLIKSLVESDVPVIVVAMRDPYALGYFPEVPAYINTYEFTPPALQMAAKAIFGKEDVKGKLPVTIQGL